MSSVSYSNSSLRSNYHVLFLGLLIIAGLIIRLLIFPYDIPITEDGSVYFWYAMDMSITNSFPENYNFPNNGWPSFLSIIFDVQNFDNYIDYMNTQRIATVIISLTTIIAIYYLCTHFFNKYYSLIGAAIFAFEPRLILDSLSGTNLTPFILLFVLSLSFLLSKNSKMVFFSFVFASLATLVRYEGILLLIPLTIVYFLRFRKKRKDVILYILMILIFILILTPMIHFRYQTDGNDGITSHLLAGMKFFTGSESLVETSSKNNLLGGEPIKNRNFSGYMDEVSIWKTELDEEKIILLYNDGSPNIETIRLTDGLVSYISFDQIISNPQSTNGLKISGSCLEIINHACKQLDGFSSGIDIRNGIIGNSAYFDGTNFIKFDDSAFPFGNSARSVSMWIFPTALSDYGNILYHSGVFQNEKLFKIYTNFWGQNSISVGILSEDVFTKSGVLNSNEWNHIVITFAGNTALNTESVKIFHNGKQLETFSSSERVIDQVDFTDNTITYFGFDLFLKYLVWITFPVFFVFLPYGIFIFFRKRNDGKISILLFSLILIIPAIYAYYREFQETKYLFILFPLLTILSLYFIREVSERRKNLKFLSVIILIPIILASIGFIDIKKLDNDFEREAFEITQIVIQKVGGINESTHNISKYAATAESFLKPNLESQKPTFSLQRLSPYSSDNVLEFITNSKDSGLTHLVVDETTKPDFLKEIFYNEEKFEYITKEFDSAQHGFNYHVKIFKIDYSKIQPKQ